MKNVIKSVVFGTLAVATTLTSCTKNYNYYDCPEGGGEQNRITLSSEVQFGVTPRLQDEQIVDGQSLTLFVTRTGSVAEENQLYKNNRITANGIGGFTYRIPMFYPSDGTAVDFYAIHPYSADATLENVISFNIQTDQSIEANYLNSDLLFGLRTNSNPQVSAVPLTFYHKLSKLNFIVNTGDASIDLNNLSEISVLGTLPQTTINVQNGNITGATGTAAPVMAYGEANVTGAIGNQQATGFTAIIVPQTISEASNLFTLNIGGSLYNFTSATSYTFETGKKYTVTIDLTTLVIDLSGSQIENWADGGSIGGPAGPQ